MEGISDIKIIGIDEQRPPLILKEPYINLYFQLSHQAPKKWCESFTRLTSNQEYPIKMNSAKGLFIETWVRRTEQVEPAFEYLKKTIQICNEQYIKQIQKEAHANASLNTQIEDDSEQSKLNKIIANLNFND